MDVRIDEHDETGALNATYIESRSNGNARIDIIVSLLPLQWIWIADVTLADRMILEEA